MVSLNEIETHTFRMIHLFAGIGGGSLGFKRARFSWRGVAGLFENILAIDSDQGACESYRRITGGRIECWDLFSRDQYRRFHGKEPPAGWREITPADIRAACGGVAPDGVFTSSPCKGLSGLLPSASAASDKYQALNELTVRGVRLVVEAFPESPPKVILFENVPRIKTRGAALLDEIIDLLRAHGYAVDQRDHDCGELGGLGQRRRRFLLIARHQKSLRPFIYKPESKPLKTIGDVIGPLPLPDDPASGPMHRLPRLKWLTWLRLALIPAGGDWRDLQRIAPEEYRLEHVPRGGGPWGVQSWDEVGASVTGSASVKGSNAAAVADPRIPESGNRHHSHFSVTRFDAPAGTVTGATHVVNGAPCVADARMQDKGGAYGGSPGLYGVSAWDGVAPAVTGSAKVSSSNCPAAIADPRLPESKGVYPNRFRVVRWHGQSPTVTGDTDVQCGAPSIDDPRLGHSPRPGVYGILRMEEVSPAVTGGQGVGVSNGPQAVADHRLGCAPRSGSYGVQDWASTSTAVIGAMDIHCGAAAVGDPRIPGPNERLDPPPVIIALDGTWHRPLTTLELAALQSFPVTLEDGSPLVLHGNSDSKWREWIGNAVPPMAAQAMAEQIGQALLQNALGETFVLGMSEVWVRPKVERVIRRQVTA